VRLIADLGLVLLVALGLESVTGIVLFAFAHGLTPKGSTWAAKVFDLLVALNLLVVQDLSFQTDLHVWVGYLSAGVVALKAIASWPTLTGWWPRRFRPRRLALEKLLAWSLFVLAPLSYATGLVLAFRVTPIAPTCSRPSPVVERAVARSLRLARPPVLADEPPDRSDPAWGSAQRAARPEPQTPESLALWEWRWLAGWDETDVGGVTSTLLPIRSCLTTKLGAGQQIQHRTCQRFRGDCSAFLADRATSARGDLPTVTRRADCLGRGS